EDAGQQFQRSQFVFADFDALVRPDSPEPALERPQHVPAFHALFLRRVEAEDHLVASRGRQRRIPIERVSVVRMKTYDGIVTAIHRGHDSSCRSKIDSKKHNSTSPQSGGGGTDQSVTLLLIRV